MNVLKNSAIQYNKKQKNYDNELSKKSIPKEHQKA